MQNYYQLLSMRREVEEEREELIKEGQGRGTLSIVI